MDALDMIYEAEACAREAARKLSGSDREDAQRLASLCRKRGPGATRPEAQNLLIEARDLLRRAGVEVN